MAHVRKRYKVETELPRQLREQLNRLLLEGMTYEEGEAWCKSQGYDIGKSSIGRYGKAYFEAYQKIIQFEDQSRALTSAVDEGMPMEEAVGKMLLQKVMAALVDGSADITENSRLLSDVAKLQSAHIHMNRWKGELEKKARKAVANIEKKSKHIDAETLRIIKEEVYGLAG
jgi:hypothetical protein